MRNLISRGGAVFWIIVSTYTIYRKMMFRHFTPKLRRTFFIRDLDFKVKLIQTQNRVWADYKVLLIINY